MRVPQRHKDLDSVPHKMEKMVILPSIGVRWFLLLIALFIVNGSAVGGSFVAQGTGVWETFQMDEQKERHVINFAVHVGENPGKQWRIEFSYPNEYIDKFVCTTDGTNILTVAHYKPKHTNIIAGYAFIERTAVPRADGYLPLSTIWLAFVSSNYIDSLTTNLICPPYFKDGRSKQSGYYPTVAFDVERESLPRGPVRTLVFYHDGKGVDSTGQWITAPQPFDAGFTNAVFNIRKSLRDAATEFGIDYFYPFSGGKAGPGYHLYLTESCRLRVTNVLEAPYRDEFHEQASARLNCLDARYVTFDSPEMRVSYLSDHFLSDLDVKSMEEYKTALRKQVGVKKSVASSAGVKRKNPRIVRFVLGTLVVVGALGLFWTLSRRKQHSNQQTNQQS